MAKMTENKEMSTIEENNLAEEKQNRSLWMEKAETLVEALPYIQSFRGKVMVVKYGGAAMIDEELKQQVIKDVALLKLVGFQPIVVHGGGKEINKWLGKLHKESKFVNGLRVTDEETVEIAEMVLNRVNKQLTAQMNLLGVKAVGISGKDGSLLHCQKKLSEGEDIGFVGDIDRVNADLIRELLDKDFVPIICPIGYDENGQSYNINADDAACRVAAAMNAEKLSFLTDVEGVYRDFEDKSSLIRSITVEEAEEMLASGILGGGMIPKLKNCVDALKEGVSQVHILNGKLPHSLLLEFFTRDGIGTMLYR